MEFNKSTNIEKDNLKFIPEDYLKPVYISSLQSVDAGPKRPQAELLRMLSHVYADYFNSQENAEKRTAEQWQALLQRFGCGPEFIGYRSGVDLDVMQTKRVQSSLSDKMGVYARHVEKNFGDLVQKEIDSNMSPADDVFHVSCTGYMSPSPVQKTLSQTERHSRVTHLYHMGCYAALPATRLAALKAQSQTGRTQIYHSELCSLHFQLSLEPYDWVIQSLFADGFISYDISTMPLGDSLKILRSAELIIPQSLEHMTWNLGSQSFLMSLSKDVPEKISNSIVPFVEGLLKGLSPKTPIFFAVHPGGPKIIQQVQKTLSLQDWQVAASKDVLFNYGNMSSATLPHIWQKILQEPEVPSGSLVVSLAFGPGLTVSGQLSEVYRSEAVKK